MVFWRRRRQNIGVIGFGAIHQSLKGTSVTSMMPLVDLL